MADTTCAVIIVMINKKSHKKAIRMICTKVTKPQTDIQSPIAKGSTLPFLMSTCRRAKTVFTMPEITISTFSAGHNKLLSQFMLWLV